MQTLFWAIGSMLVMLLVISFLKLGLTYKGKVIIVMISFVLALGCLTAVASFPLWQTALMLTVLSFFVAYFIDNRLGILLYKENPIDKRPFDALLETSDFKDKIDNDFLQFNDELPIADSSLLNIQKIKKIEITKPKQSPHIEKDIVGNLQKLEEEISFLLERTTEEEEEEVHLNIAEPEIEYLSDIESLLASETEEKVRKVDNIGEEVDDLSTKDFHFKKSERHDAELEPLDDYLFDFLLATKEEVAAYENTLEEINPGKKVVLQK